MLRLKKIEKDYKVADSKVKALKGIDLTFRKNEFVSILGPSGCGKTTLLNIIGGLDKYTKGDLFISGKSTKKFLDRDWDIYRNHRIGFIFQAYNLIPHQTVLGNVELALTISGISKEERIKRAKEAIDRVGLKGQYNKKPNQLSGGQCQRVAIARALVNEPEVLLADEPTGALDSETSVQIMELIKEISKDKLVIMVTHNPDLANKYSTRIINLFDGNVISDSNPYTEQEEMADEESINKIEVKEKAKMSFFTALMLSFKNLLSKKKRTIMTIIAGSIGIIGVSAVLAVSQGVRDYIDSIQDDLLSGNPIKVTKSGIDYNALLNSSSLQNRNQAIKKSTEKGKINVNSAVKYLVENEKALDSLTFNNEFNPEYLSYVLSMPKEYYNAISMRYGMNVNYNIYTDFNVSNNKADPNYLIKKEFDKHISLDAINQTYAKSLVKVLNALDYNGPKAEAYASIITGLSQPLSQSINFENDNYIKTQYELVAGNYPKDVEGDDKEVLLVLDKDSMVTDLALAQLGYYSWEEFYNLIYSSLNETKDYHIKVNNVKESFSYEELMNKTFRWYPNNYIFTKGLNSSYNYSYIEPENCEEMLNLKVTGIIKLKDGISYGPLGTGFLYSEKTAKEMIKRNIDSEITKYIKNSIIEDEGNINSDSIKSDITYDLSYYWESINSDSETLNSFNGEAIRNNTSKVYVGESDGNSSGMSLFMNSGSQISNMSKSLDEFKNLLKFMIKDEYVNQFDEFMNQAVERILTQSNSTKTIQLQTFGGTYLPNSIEIYPTSFDIKDKVTDYLDQWNKIEGVGAKTLVFDLYEDDFSSIKEYNYKLDAKDRQEIKYTDSVGLIINMINTLINIITYALVAFTALSLVVSTVMVGIITYVSVVERTKEIGVIRSLGGRKKDVSHLFNAETFMIGLSSGIFGIVITGLLALILNGIIKAVSDNAISTIAHLTLSTSIIMILVSIILTTISGFVPARAAAKRNPVDALRSE